jgi:hypothetical protein
MSEDYQEDYKGFADDLVNAIDTRPPSRFTRTMRKTVTSILMQMVVPWLERCFLKYTEQDFHQKVLYENFDFISDWQVNHPALYWDFINSARNRVVKTFIDFNVIRITNKIIALLQHHGWTIYPQEYEVIRDTVRRVRVEIYGY